MANEQGFENSLSKVDRLGLAWCRLNRHEWDRELLGDKPDGDSAFRNAMKAIESMIGEANISRCWYVFEVNKTEEEWFKWYTTKCFQYAEEPNTAKSNSVKVACLSAVATTIVFRIVLHLLGA